MKKKRKREENLKLLNSLMLFNLLYGIVAILVKIINNEN